MATQWQFRRGTTAEHASFTGAQGEVTVDTTKKVVVVHDGSTAGGVPMAKASTTLSGYGITDAYTISQIEEQIDAKASLASPAFTGTPTAPTATVGTNTTQLATTAFVYSVVDTLETIGESQSYADVTASRSTGVTYTNTTSRPILVILTTASGGVATYAVDGLTICNTDAAGTTNLSQTITFIVPVGSTYYASGYIERWVELR